MHRNIILVLLLLIFIIFIQCYFSIKEPYGETNFDSNNYEVQYHDDISTIIADDPNYKDNSYKIDTVDEDGNPATIILSSTMGNATYYTPGSFKYGAASYVPNYTDSILLSKTFNPKPK